MRYNIINLDRQRWAQNALSYQAAVEIAEELEAQTGQLHGVERGY